jgi:uncharacterized membrane protein
MKRNLLFTLLMLLIAAVPLGYLLSTYGSLPETIPTHFNASGKPDGFGGRSTVWITSGMLAAVSVGLFVLVLNLPKIDPKKTAKLSAQVFQKIGIAVVVLLAGINIAVIYSTVHGTFNDKLVLPLMGLFFVYMGNMMHSIKPNYFIGLRLPWTLEDPDNWRVTHQLGGKVWFAGGIIITVGTLLLPEKTGMVAMLCTVAVMVLVPVIYSYRYFKQHQHAS